MLQVLNKDQQVLSGPVKSFHNGFTGGSEEVLIYIKNTHVDYYYQNITLEVVMSDLVSGDIFSQSGWSVKLAYQSEQPTEKEWGDIFVNNKIELPAIGTSTVADIQTLYPVWIRVFCPGHSIPDIKSDMSLKLKYSKKVVGDV